MARSYLSRRVRIGRSAIAGDGLVCVEPIAAGEVVAVFAGDCLDRDEVEALPPDVRSRCVQIDEGVYLAPSPASTLNHSCAPNCALDGQVSVVARRPIAAGEELTVDDATRNGGDHDEFVCNCGVAECRGKITGHDWMLPELQRRYRGEFSPYLTRRIDALVAPAASRRAFAY